MKDEQRQLRKVLNSRALFVEMRTWSGVSIRAGLRLLGAGIKACEPEDFVGHVEAEVLPKDPAVDPNEACHLA